MNTKKDFERLITNIDPHQYEKLWGLVGPLQFLPAFRHISEELKLKFFEGLTDSQIKNMILEDDEEIFDQDPEECRQLILDNVWRIL